MYMNILKQANELLKAELFEDSIALYEQALKEYPDFSEIIKNNIEIAKIRMRSLENNGNSTKYNLGKSNSKFTSSLILINSIKNKSFLEKVNDVLSFKSTKDLTEKSRTEIVSLQYLKSENDVNYIFDKYSSSIHAEYLRPFKVSKFYWINQILALHDNDEVLVLSELTEDKESEFLSSFKYFSEYREKADNDVVFEYYSSSNLLEADDHFEWFYLKRSILRSKIGFFLGLKTNLPVCDFIFRIVDLFGIDKLGENAKRVYEEFRVKLEDEKITQDPMLMGLCLLHKNRKNNEKSSFVSENSFKYDFLYEWECFSPDNLSLISFKEQSINLNKKDEDDVYVFSFDSYFEKSYIDPRKINRNHVDIPTVANDKNVKLVIFENKEKSAASYGLPALKEDGNQLFYIDLLPVGNFRHLNLDNLEHDRRVPLFLSIPKISSIKFEADSDLSCNEEATVSVVFVLKDNAMFNYWSLYSVLQQSYTNIEILILSASSDNKKLENISRFLSFFPGVKSKILSIQNEYLVEYLINIGVIESNGVYVLPHDLLEFSNSQRVFLSLLFLKERGVNILSTKFNNSKTLNCGNEYSNSNNKIFFKRNICKDIGFLTKGGGDFFDRAKDCYGYNNVIWLNLKFSHPIIVNNNSNSAYAMFSSGNSSLITIDNKKDFFNDHDFLNCSDKKNNRKLSREDRYPISNIKKIVANVATIPKRQALFPKVLESILPQVDKINIFLNEFDDIPLSFLELFNSHKDKIVFYRSQDIGNLRDNVKFYFVDNNDCYYLTIDDDIDYPWDYVSKLIYKSKLYEDKAVICVHGYCYWSQIKSFHADNQRRSRYFHYERDLESDVFVENAGTGTVLIPPGLPFVNMNAGPYGFVDVLFSNQAKNAAIPIVAINRKANWLKSLVDVQGEESLFVINQNSDRAKQILAYLPDPDKRIPTFPKKSEAIDFGGDGKSLLHFFSDKAVDWVFNSKLDKVYICCTGYNYASYVEKFITSLHRSLRITNFRDIELLFLDDSSNDGSEKKLIKFLEKYLGQWKYSVFRTDENLGQAFARAFLLEQVDNPNSPCVFLDMDDEVECGLLKRILAEYFSSPETAITLGSWGFNNINQRAFPIQTQMEIDEKLYFYPPFKFGHTRTLRAGLFKNAHLDLLIGPDGKWLKYCTDLALMLGLFDLVEPCKIKRIYESLYRYNLDQNNGTIKKYGAMKKTMRDYLYSKAHEFYHLSTSSNLRFNTAYQAMMMNSKKKVKKIALNKFGSRSL